MKHLSSTVLIGILILTVSACTNREISTGTHNGGPYQLVIVNSCENQTLDLKAEEKDPELSTTEIGVFYDDKQECAGVWQFSYGIGPSLSLIEPEMYKNSFAEIGYEFHNIVTSNQRQKNGWVIVSNTNQRPIYSSPGEQIQVTYGERAIRGKTITLELDFSEDTEHVTINEIPSPEEFRPS